MAIKTYVPPVVPHPGEHLREWLEENNMTSKELALRLRKPEKTISAILNGKSSITADMADALSLVTGISSQMWNNLQANYKDYVTAQSKQDFYETQWDIWGVHFPYSEMTKRGWIPKESPTNQEKKVRQLLSFFGISNCQAFNSIYGSLTPQFRLTKGANHDPFSTAAWLRQAELIAHQIPVEIFEKKRVQEAIPEFKQILLTPDQSQGILVQKASKLGIALVILPYLPGASISGVAMWLGTTPVIVLSGKGKRHDSFVFNFFHELGHILLHRGRNQQKRIFLDGENEDENDDPSEIEANEFASDALIPSPEIISCALSHKQIKQLADKHNVHTCVVLGQLAKKGRISWQACNTKYKSLMANTILPS